MDVYKSDLLRNNGTEWLHFGEAVMGCARRIEFRFFQSVKGDFEYQVYAANQNEPEYERVWQWVRSHFEVRLNFSPIEPVYKSGVVGNCVILYAAESGLTEDTLLTIPIREETVQRGVDETLARMQSLTTFMKRVPQPF